MDINTVRALNTFGVMECTPGGVEVGIFGHT